MTDFKHIREQIARSRELERAYSTDFFGPVEGDPMKKTGEYASKENRSLIARNSAAMGRFLYEAHIGPLLDTMQALLDRNRVLEGERKHDCVAFFRWFWNQPGTNAEQGYDAWLQEQSNE